MHPLKIFMVAWQAFLACVVIGMVAGMTVQAVRRQSIADGYLIGGLSGIYAGMLTALGVVIWTLSR